MQKRDLVLPSLQQIENTYSLLKKRNLETAIQTLTDKLYLKLDYQLPGGSYKIRGVAAFTDSLPKTQNVIQVLSAGNLALAASIAFKANNIHCEAIVPEAISTIKKQKLIAQGASIKPMPFNDVWQQVLDTSLYTSQSILHPFNVSLLAGYGTIIPELLAQGLNDIVLVVPYGLGGLAIALANAIQCYNASIELVVAEIENHAPFTRAINAGEPVKGEKLNSFIEAMGTPCVIDEAFYYLKDRISKTILVNESEVKTAIRDYHKQYQMRIEGAAGAAFAAAKKLITDKPVVALLTGQNISEDVFEGIVGSLSHIPA